MRQPEPGEDVAVYRKPQDVVEVPKGKPVANVPERVAQPGDRICGACGEPNDPTRKFCRRCGTSLVEARVVRRRQAALVPADLRRRQKQPKQYAAGERIDSMQKGSTKPKPKGIGGAIAAGAKSVGLVRGLLGLVVLIGIFGYIGIPSVRGVVERRLLAAGPSRSSTTSARRSPPRPPSRRRPRSSASGETLADFPATNLWDKNPHTEWRGTDQLPTFTVTFKEKIDPMFFIIHNGSAENFVDFRRPSKVELVFPDGSSQVLDLEDVHELRSFEMSANGIDSLTIKVLAFEGPPDQPISISEIEFNKKT